MDSKQLVTGQFSQIYSENILYFGKNYNYIVRSRNNQGTSNHSVLTNLRCLIKEQLS